MNDDYGARGVPPGELSDEDLTREMNSLHRTRDDTLRHGPPDALAAHNRRSAELEAEYLRRFPGREVTRGKETTYDPEQPDIGGEHTTATFADELPGGPERAEEAESPRGLAGLEPTSGLEPT